MFKCDCCGCCCRNLDKSDLYSDLDRGDGVCRYLTDNLCSIYDVRPLLCRIDECYERFFQQEMGIDEYYMLNEKECRRLKGLEERDMPLPLILGVGAAIAGITGVGSGIHGAAKMKEANDTMKAAEDRHKRNIAKFERSSESANKKMDELGKLELTILNGFEKFSDTIEKIQNRPKFKEYSREGIKLPKYDKEELKNVSVGAGVLLGGLGGAAAGTAGGFAAAGATTSAVMALGTASTGTAIASLSGAAATNATLAALGGGAIAAGGGGIALGTTILGATTLGIGLLVGGAIFNITGGKMSDKADEAWNQMKKAECKINDICDYLSDLEGTAAKYTDSLNAVYKKYLEYFNFVSHVVNSMNKTDWDDFSQNEKIATQNTVLLVGLLYQMCKVKLVNKAEGDAEINSINREAVNEALDTSVQVIGRIEPYMT